jgi:hypothetical protein
MNEREAAISAINSQIKSFFQLLRIYRRLLFGRGHLTLVRVEKKVYSVCLVACETTAGKNSAAPHSRRHDIFAHFDSQPYTEIDIRMPRTALLGLSQPDVSIATFGSASEGELHASRISIRLGTYILPSNNFHLKLAYHHPSNYDSFTPIHHLEHFFRIYHSSSLSGRASNSASRFARLSIPRRLATRPLDFCNRYMSSQLGSMSNHRG